MTDHARVVIIGGGAVGCSALYHLAKLGWTDCLLLERDELTSGSTWHAAGNCPNFSTSWNVIKLQRHSTKLYARLGEETGYPINYHITGSLRLAHSRDRMDEYKHVACMAQAQGIEFELLSPAEAKSRHPFLELHDLQGALWDPYDGDIDPSQLTQAYAKGAKDLGCRIQRFTRVTALAQKPDGGWRITTDKGEVEAEVVVNAAGYRAGEIMAMVGQYLPIVSLEHQYLLTESIPELTARKTPLPLLRDPDVSYYLRQERDALLLGPYEKEKAVAQWADAVPENFAYQLFPDSLDRLESYIEDAIGRVPILGKVGMQKVINGPIPYSPDGNPYIGPAHGLQQFLPLLLLQLRHRAVRRRRQDRRRMDRPWRAGMGFLDPRPAALHRLRDQDLCRRQGAGALSERICHRLPLQRMARRPPGQDHRALRQTEEQGRHVLRPRRLGARDLVPARPRTSRSSSPASGAPISMTPWPRNARPCASRSASSISAASPSW